MGFICSREQAVMIKNGTLQKEESIWLCLNINVWNAEFNLQFLKLTTLEQLHLWARRKSENPKRNNQAEMKQTHLKSANEYLVARLVFLPLRELKCLNSCIKINENFYSAWVAVAGTMHVSLFQAGNGTAPAHIHPKECWAGGNSLN